jgi:hypothetical protein
MKAALTQVVYSEMGQPVELDEEALAIIILEHIGVDAEAW